MSTLHSLSRPSRSSLRLWPGVLFMGALSLWAAPDSNASHSHKGDGSSGSYSAVEEKKDEGASIVKSSGEDSGAKLTSAKSEIVKTAAEEYQAKQQAGAKSEIVKTAADELDGRQDGSARTEAVKAFDQRRDSGPGAELAKPSSTAKIDTAKSSALGEAGIASPLSTAKILAKTEAAGLTGTRTAATGAAPAALRSATPAPPAAPAAPPAEPNTPPSTPADETTGSAEESASRTSRSKRSSSSATSASSSGGSNNTVATAISLVKQAQSDIKSAAAGSQSAKSAALAPTALLGAAELALKVSGPATAWAKSLVTEAQNLGSLTPVANAAAELLLHAAESLPSVAQGLMGAAGKLSSTVGSASGDSSAISAAQSSLSQAKQDSYVDASVPMETINNHGAPESITWISVGGGPMVPVVVDTGSEGLVIQKGYTGPDLGAATGANTSASYFNQGPNGFLNYEANGQNYTSNVTFADGLSTTKPVPVDVTTTSESGYPGNSGKAPNGQPIVGILGVGNEGGPFSTSPIESLPGELKDGVTLNIKDNSLDFGPNPQPSRITLPNAEGNTPVNVTIGNTTTAIGDKTGQNNTLTFDSGEQTGYFQSGLVGKDQTTQNGATYITPSTPITVTAPNGKVIYSYTTTPTIPGLAPLVAGPGSAGQGVDVPDSNTGEEPFYQQPVHISYGDGNPQDQVIQFDND